MAKSKHDYYGQRNSEAVSKLHLTAPGTFVMKTSILISANTSVRARQETWLSWYARATEARPARLPSALVNFVLHGMWKIHRISR